MLRFANKKLVLILITFFLLLSSKSVFGKICDGTCSEAMDGCQKCSGSGLQYSNCENGSWSSWKSCNGRECQYDPVNGTVECVTPCTDTCTSEEKCGGAVVCGYTCNGCPEGDYCSNQNCVGKKDDGGSCGANYQCKSDVCNGGVCRTPCVRGWDTDKCINNDNYYCGVGGFYVYGHDCPYELNGIYCSGAGICTPASGYYYEQIDCGPNATCGSDTCGTGEACVDAWSDSGKFNHLSGYPKCIPQDTCEEGACVAKWDTCGGDANCSAHPGQVSHVDSCTHIGCGAPCTAVPTPGCTENCDCANTTCVGQTCQGNCNYACEGRMLGTSPSAPTLTYPTNGATIAKSASDFNGGFTAINMTWNPPSDWGTCDTNRRYYLCLVASNNYTAGMDVCSPSVSGLKTWTTTTNYNWPEAYAGTFYWKVVANNGGGAAGGESPTWSYTVIQNSAPVVSNFVIKNEASSTIFADGSNSNHICQVNGVGEADLFTNRFVRFEATVTDAEAQALTVNMNWNGTNHTMTKVGASNVYRYDSANILPNASSTISITATDTMGASTLLNTGRTFKVWDCQVNVSGTIYDGSSGYACSTNGFNFGAGAEMNFNSLVFDLVSTGGNDNVNMTVVPTYSYNGGANRLTWGKRYLPAFNGLNGVGSLTRVSADGAVVSCNTTQTTQIVPNAYAVSPTIVLDYSFVQNQDAWFQVNGGGINSNTRVASMVPVTCANNQGICTPAMSRISGQNENGLVISADIDNEAGCAENVCTFGSPNNWGLRKEGLMTKNKVDYEQLLRVYYKTLGKGATFPDGTTLTQVKTNSAVDKDKVAFVNGELVIDINNTVDVGNFLMLVAKSIRINDSVTRVDGVLVADNGIEAVGNGTAATINGMVYSAGRNSSIRLMRDLGGDSNNETPGIVVNYRPDLLFNMPAELMMGMERE